MATIKNMWRNIIHDISLNRICLILFISIYVGFYFTDFIHYIKYSYVFLLLGFGYSFIKYQKVCGGKFILMGGIFILYSFFSSIWSVSPVLTINSSVQLLKSFAVSVLLIQLIRSYDDLKCALFFLFLAGIVFALNYFNMVNLSDLGDERITRHIDNETLPNINVVAMIVSMSFVYFLFASFQYNRILYFIFTLLSALLTVLSGSRKSIIVLLLGCFLLFLKAESKQRIKLCLLLALFILMIIMVIPTEYLSFIFERLEQLNFFSETQMLDRSDQIRVSLFSNGIRYFIDRPLFGYGFYNFSQVNGVNTGLYYYSHNNFIEILVGGGIISFVLYYIIYYMIFKDTYSKNGITTNNKYIIIVLIAVLLFNHIGIVVLLDRYVWVLLAVLYMWSTYNKQV